MAPLPRMSAAEIALLRSFLSRSRNYLEFGAGGSTLVAAQLVAGSVTSVDSSAKWLADVARACADAACPVRPALVHVDIGPIGDWGWPTDPATRPRWPAYHETVWRQPRDLDLCLIDGRFRVACFMQTLLHCRVDTVLLLHDFSRAYYHVVREVAREIAGVDELAAFVPRALHGERARALLAAHRFDGA